MTTPAQNRQIHALRREVPGLDDVAYRALLARQFNVVSSRELDAKQADALIAELRHRAPPTTGGDKPGKARAGLTGPYAKALQALWIAGWNLGLVRDRRDSALLAFVTRQTGIEHTRFLIAQADAAKAVEALKAWLARDGGVVWPKGDAPLARKRAVALAIAARLGAMGDPAYGPSGTSGEAVLTCARAHVSPGCALADYDLRQWDRIAEAMGLQLRALLGARAELHQRGRDVA